MLEPNTSSEETLPTWPLVISLTVRSHTHANTHICNRIHTLEMGYTLRNTTPLPCLFLRQTSYNLFLWKRVLTITIRHVDDGVEIAVESYH